MLTAGSRTARFALYGGIAFIIIIAYTALFRGSRAEPDPSTFWHESEENRPKHPWPAPLGLSQTEAMAEDPKAHEYVAPTTFNDSIAAPCNKIPGGDDIVVVMRTGATEIRDKLPVHFQTSFRCYPHILIFSDFAETFEGHQVFDVLSDVDTSVKETNEDFEHYKHINAVGSQGLDPSELSGQVSDYGTALGKGENAGWRLDKWKFLPMMEQTLRQRPDKKWYVFVEPDSYLVWSNLLQWLPTMDASKPYYAGSPVQIGDDVFAHGGSVFVLSQPALAKVAEEYSSHKQHWHDYTSHHWAGDCVLGVALRETGVELSWASPSFQGGNPATMDWGDRSFWCAPALSYHHLNPLEKLHMWNVEQDWIRNQHTANQKPALLVQDTDTILRHGDVCRAYLLPQMGASKKGWNNQIEDQQDYTIEASFDTCYDLCEKAKSCVQFTLTPTGCVLGDSPKLGRPMSSADSGWLMHRVDKWITDREKEGCEGEGGWMGGQ